MSLQLAGMSRLESRQTDLYGHHVQFGIVNPTNICRKHMQFKRLWLEDAQFVLAAMRCGKTSSQPYSRQ